MAPQPEPFNPVERIARDPLLRSILWLVKNGVPFDVAHSLTYEELQGWGIALGELDGGRYDFDANEWVRPDAPTP